MSGFSSFISSILSRSFSGSSRRKRSHYGRRHYKKNVSSGSGILSAMFSSLSGSNHSIGRRRRASVSSWWS